MSFGRVAQPLQSRHHVRFGWQTATEIGADSSPTSCYVPKMSPGRWGSQRWTSLLSPDLQSFLTLVEAAIRHESCTDEPVRVATEAVLKMPSSEVGEAEAA